MPLLPPENGGLRFLARLQSEPSAPEPMTYLDALLVEAELMLVQGGRVDASWSEWLSAAEAFWDSLGRRDQRLVGTPRDILNRWALNGSYFLEVDEGRDLLRIHTADPLPPAAEERPGSD